MHFTLFSSCNGYKLNSHLTCFQRGFIAQSVEHHTGITEIMVSNFFWALFCNCLSYCMTAKTSFTSVHTNVVVTQAYQIHHTSYMDTFFYVYVSLFFSSRFSFSTFFSFCVIPMIMDVFPISLFFVFFPSLTISFLHPSFVVSFFLFLFFIICSPILLHFVYASFVASYLMPSLCLLFYLSFFHLLFLCHYDSLTACSKLPVAA